MPWISGTSSHGVESMPQISGILFLGRKNLPEISGISSHGLENATEISGTASLGMQYAAWNLRHGITGVGVACPKSKAAHSMGSNDIPQFRECKFLYENHK